MSQKFSYLCFVGFISPSPKEFDGFLIIKYNEFNLSYFNPKKGIKNQMEILKIREHRELAERAAKWFHAKWSIPVEAYQESIAACLRGDKVIPQWYVALEQDEIIGGLGVIENDFHDRTDLTPNVCAVYVEKAWRCQGIAGALLRAVCEDMRQFEIKTLYLLTDHTNFYERYGWEFLCLVQGDGETEPARMYGRSTNSI